MTDWTKADAVIQAYRDSGVPTRRMTDEEREEHERHMAVMGFRRYDCLGCGWASWLKADELDHCHSRPSSAYPNCIHLEARST